MTEVCYFVHGDNYSWCSGEVEVYEFYDEAVTRAKEIAEERGTEDPVFISKGEKIATVELKAIVVNKNEAKVIPVKKRK